MHKSVLIYAVFEHLLLNNMHCYGYGYAMVMVMVMVGAVHSAASSHAAKRMVAGSCPVLGIA